MARPMEHEGPIADLAKKTGGVTALAGLCDVSVNTIERWMTGKRIPHVLVQRMLNEMARTYGVSPLPFQLPKKPR